MANKTFFSDEQVNIIMTDRKITDRERFCFEYFYLKNWKIDEIAVALFTYEKRRKFPNFINNNCECYSYKTVSKALQSVRAKAIKIHQTNDTL